MKLQEHRKSVDSANLVKSVIGGALIGGAFCVARKWLAPRHHTIPPIIIKSDASELETEADLIDGQRLEDAESSVSAADLSTRARPYHYRTGNLSVESKVVRIIKYNEDAVILPIEYFYPSFSIGSTLSIWLQRFRKSSKTWEWINEAEPQIQITKIGGSELKMEFDDRLSPRQDNEHSKRAAKYKYSAGGNQNLRFGKLHVSGYRPLSTIAEGDEYIISFNVH